MQLLTFKFRIPMMLFAILLSAFKLMMTVERTCGPVTINIMSTV